MSDLTDICETLRFVEDRSKRGGVLESLLMAVNLPECGYLPLCKSTEPFQRVLKITANEAKAFSTKVGRRRRWGVVGGGKDTECVSDFVPYKKRLSSYILMPSNIVELY